MSHCLALAWSLLLFVMCCHEGRLVQGQQPQMFNCETLGPCSCKAGSGDIIDLSPIASKDPTNPRFLDEPVYGSISMDTFSYNPCLPFDEGYGCYDVAACQIQAPPQGGVYPIGTQTAASFKTDPTDGLLIEYGDGSLPVPTRTSLVQLLCDENVDGDLKVFGEGPTSVYKFSLTTKYACIKDSPGTTGGGLSAGSVMCILLLVAVLVYVIGGVLFMRFRREATGKEMVPNLGFWTEVPILVKDGALFTFRGCKAGGSAYEEL